MRTGKRNNKYKKTTSQDISERGRGSLHQIKVHQRHQDHSYLHLFMCGSQNSGDLNLYIQNFAIPERSRQNI